MTKKKVALALSAGGAKGYAHIGVIKGLEEAGYEITSIAGTSMGALVGGLYAAGKLDEAYEWLKSITDWKVFKLADLKNLSHRGLIDGEYIFEELHKIVGDVRIENLPISFCCVAADLKTGEEKVFRSGRLLDAIRASVSMPVIFTPYAIRGKRYVDGGVVNGLPINHVKRRSGDELFAINLDTYGKGVVTEIKDSSLFSTDDLRKYMVQFILPTFLPSNFFLKTLTTLMVAMVPRIWKELFSENIITILLDSFYISLKQNKLKMVDMMKPDLYLNIDLKGYSTNNFSDAQKIARLGYEQMCSELVRH